MSAPAPTTRPARPRGAWLKNPRLPREEETIGGGFFVFRRGEETGRIRPALWPFEHATEEAAINQAKRLAAEMPGYRFDVLKVVVGVTYPADEPELIERREA